MAGLDWRLRRDHRIVAIASGIAAAFVVIQAATPLVSVRLTELFALTNGVVFALYASAFYFVRRTPMDQLRALCVLILGLTHVFWVVLVWDVLSVNMLVATAAVLGLAVALLSWQARMLVPIAAMLVVSLAMFYWAKRPGMAWLMPSSLGALHIGLLGALIPDTLRRLARPRPDYLCNSCGYDLRGLPAATCPECGTTASR